jgi:iron(II)-dependent oxidoreductase
MKKLLAVVCGLALSMGGVTVSAAGQVDVPAGSFQMGCSLGGQGCDQDEGPVGGIAVEVPAFRIDTHEVTVAGYQDCMKAGKCVRPNDHALNQYCNLGAEGRDGHPMNCVDWDDAVAYCQWRGMRLPREAEWEKAARAGSRTAFPWGDEVSCKQAILDDGVTRGSKG